MGKKIILTVDERVILHLNEFTIHEEDFEAPEGTTQAGIADGICIARKHVPRAVNKLIQENMVATRVSHVKGAKQRKKVYYLTLKGKDLGRRIWDTLAKRDVVLRAEDGTETPMTVSELCFTRQVGKSPVQILMGLRDGNVYSPGSECLAEEPETAVGDRSATDTLSVYRKALSRAWEDNILTREEAAILSELRLALRISDTDHRRLQDDILESKDPVDEGVNRLRLFTEVLGVALRDGKITQDEQDMLDELRGMLGIGEEKYVAILAQRSGSGSHSRLDETREEIYTDIYASVLKEALKDGRRGNEKEIVLLLKKLLSMEEQAQSTMKDNVRKYD